MREVSEESEPGAIHPEDLRKPQGEPDPDVTEPAQPEDPAPALSPSEPPDDSASGEVVALILRPAQINDQRFLAGERVRLAREQYITLESVGAARRA